MENFKIRLENIVEKMSENWGDESSSLVVSSSLASFWFSCGTETELSFPSNISWKSYCNPSKFRPSVVIFGLFGGRGFLKGGLKFSLLEDYSSEDICKSMN
jgi:hypothetical protein